MDFKQNIATHKPQNHNPSNNAPFAKNNNFAHSKNNQIHKPGSDKFKIQKPFDEDVSMRTYQSKIQVHNHETQELESDTQIPTNTSLLESDDDDYFEGDELNFLLVTKEKQKHKKQFHSIFQNSDN